jgi:hypothetical protein
MNDGKLSFLTGFFLNFPLFNYRVAPILTNKQVYPLLHKLTADLIIVEGLLCYTKIK